MFLAYILVIIIGISWIIKMIIQRKVFIQTTPLDIPIAIFLASQLVSTFVSFDNHISIWGYYSRFNGGLLSMLSYVLLYYAFLSNFKAAEILKVIDKILKISLVAGIIVALWGLPSHFGYDPTCFVFRGTLDVSCWTADFQPKVRIFSTLGQPAWLGAYLAMLIPISLAYFLKEKLSNRKPWILGLIYLSAAILFYVDLLFTKSRAAFIAVWVGLAVFAVLYYFSQIKEAYKNRKNLKLNLNFRKISLHGKMIMATIFIFLGITVFAGQPFEQLKRFTLDNKTSEQKQAETAYHGGALGGTDSGKIRLFVWQGALDAFRHYPIFGTGVETFAFAYYQYKPVGHNLTSEWNYLYNKAHNEYLNFLATTGIIGLASYLAVIGLFLWAVWKLTKTELQKNQKTLILALTGGYVSILITNFFGFSVVIMNVYLFLIPAFVFAISGLLNQRKMFEFFLGRAKTDLSMLQKTGVISATLGGLYLIFFFVNFWFADLSFAFGSNLQRAGEYQSAYPYLRNAVTKASFEPTFRDEYAINLATLATMAAQDEASESAKIAEELAKEAVLTTEFITQKHPKNVVFWKSKVRVFYTLSQVDERYFPETLRAIKEAQKLAPTDANISYNLGLIYGQTGDTKNAIETLEKTIKLKPNYTNAYYALGLYYHQAAINERGAVVDLELQDKAIEQMKFILEKLDPQNELAKEALETWERELPSPSS